MREFTLEEKRKLQTMRNEQNRIQEKKWRIIEAQERRSKKYDQYKKIMKVFGLILLFIISVLTIVLESPVIIVPSFVIIMLVIKKLFPKLKKSG